MNNYLRKAVRSVLIILKSLRIPLPDELSRRVESWKAYSASSRISKKVFGGRKILKVDDSRWQLDPMPSELELSSFYSTVYWAGRGKSTCLVTERDLSQYSLIANVFSELLSSGTPKRFLNFGAGHGGLSYLARMRGFHVTNVDPYISTESMFTAVTDLSQIKDQVDFIYASHSLEHVTDVISTMQEFDRLLNDGGYIFVEVPNPNYPAYSLLGSDGVRSPSVQIPHTQYLSKNFFIKSGFDVVSLGTFRYEGDRFGSPSSSDDGEVIRFLGRVSSHR